MFPVDAVLAAAVRTIADLKAQNAELVGALREIQAEATQVKIHDIARAAIAKAGGE